MLLQLLLLLLACSCSTPATGGWLGPCRVGRERLQPRNKPHGNTPRGLAYMSTFGGRQQDDSHGIRRLRSGSWSMLMFQGCICGGTRHLTSRRNTCAVSRVRGRGVDSTGRLRHRLSMLNNEGRGVEVFSDQCGDVFHTGTSPSPPSIPFSPLDPQLTVCGAPDCGVSFSQYARCKEEYTGCCSAAGQALAEAQATAPMGAPSMISGEIGMPVEHRLQRLNGNDGERLASRGVSGSAKFSEAGSFQRKGGTAVSARASSTDQGKTLSSSSGSRGAGSNAKDAAARAAEKGKRKRAEGGDESLLESYASRHSEEESSCLAAVREDTDRSQPGGAHMVSGHLQGELLKLLVRLSGAKRVLDIGTFTGYSALAFAEALPEDGVVVTLESDSRAAETAQGHFASSQHGCKIRLVLGKAMNGIDEMIAEDVPQFDVIFIDADKKRYGDYYDKLLSGPRPLLGPKGMLLADNVLFHELVPMAETMAAATTAPPAPPAQRTVNTMHNPEKAVGGGNNEVDKLQPSVSETGTGSGLQDSLPGREERRPGVVGGGVLPATPRRMKIAESLDGFNKHVKEDGRVEVVMLPFRDGLSVVTWRPGGYPAGDKS